MRNNKGGHILAVLILIGVGISAILTGPGKFTFITLLVMLGISLIYNLVALASD